MIEFFYVLKGSEWEEKLENLELELQQCYKAQVRLTEQLGVEVAESRASKTLVQDKEAIIFDLQNDLNKARFYFLLYFPHILSILF